LKRGVHVTMHNETFRWIVRRRIAPPPMLVPIAFKWGMASNEVDEYIVSFVTRLHFMA